MKAAVVERPGSLVVKEIPEPALGEYDALCQLLYGATCTGTDQHLIAGRFPWPVQYPTILGHESIGRVVDIGPKVRNYRPGDLVTRVGTPGAPTVGLASHWGGFAEYGIARDHWAMAADGCPESEWRGYRWNQVLPAEFDPAAATMIITWRETFSYLTRLGFHAGQTLLVVGSGGNGLSFAAHAHNLGAAQVAMIGNAGRAPTATRVGVSHYFDYRMEHLPEAVNAVCPSGFDVIIDALGRRDSLDQALRYLRPEGTVGVYGIDEFGAWRINPANARGSFTFANRAYDEAESHAQIVQFIQQGKLDARPWLHLDRAFPLAAIGDAFAVLARREMVKALIRLSPTAER